MAFRDSPAPAKSAGVIVIVALVVLVVLKQGFAGIDIELN